LSGGGVGVGGGDSVGEISVGVGASASGLQADRTSTTMHKNKIILFMTTPPIVMLIRIVQGSGDLFNCFDDLLASVYLPFSLRVIRVKISIRSITP
jgi:hypothetical protein